MTSATPPPDDASVGELMSRLTADLTTLIRDELQVAQLETTAKAKRLGVGAGAFGVAALVALFGLGAWVAAAILGLASAVDGWLAALLVGAALFAVAGVAALVGKRDVAAAAPPYPAAAAEGIKTDVRAMKGSAHR